MDIVYQLVHGDGGHVLVFHDIVLGFHQQLTGNDGCIAVASLLADLENLPLLNCRKR